MESRTHAKKNGAKPKSLTSREKNTHRKMNKIVLNFDWKYKLPSVARFQFQIDLDKLGDESGDMSEFPCFYIDLATGEILGVPSEISCGDGYRYSSCASWLIASDGGWIGYNESLDEQYSNLPESKLNDEFIELFENNHSNNFNEIVDKVCDYARSTNLKDKKCTGLFDKYINNYDVPSL